MNINMNVMNKLKLFKGSVCAVAAITLLSGCGKDLSNSTGWTYNDPKNGGFEVQPYGEQETGPGLIFVEGGSYTMGQTEDDVMYEQNNMARNVTVSSFYMDETEIRNVDWREYVYWLLRVFGQSLPEVPKKALPDTLQWRDELAYNEEYVEWYFRHPAYNEYPVVGVSWEQANAYCRWRTDRANEKALIANGLIDAKNPYLGKSQIDFDRADSIRKNLTLKKQNKNLGEYVLIPDFRLPTEAEWEAERNNGGTGFWGTGSLQNNAAGAFASPLKLPMSGYRERTNGSINIVGTGGVYWSSTVSGASSRDLFFQSGSASIGTADSRAQASSVRCLKN